LFIVERTDNLRDHCAKKEEVEEEVVATVELEEE